MKPNLVSYACAIVLLALVPSAKAQSTWNYVISDAGNGNSLVTWNVTGDLASPPGPMLNVAETSLRITVVAPGIYTGTYQADGTSQTITTPDGSYFDYYPNDLYAPIVGYATDTAAGNANDSFSLIAAPLIPRTMGLPLVYYPGTQSVTIPVDFSNFNPGTYQSQESGFSTALTVNLTVVPEPSTLALMACAGISITLTKRKKRCGSTKAACRTGAFHP